MATSCAPEPLWRLLASRGVSARLCAQGRVVMISATPQRQFRAVPAFEVIPTLAGAFAVLVGVLTLIGWWRDIPALRTIIPGLIPMIPNTAVACIVGGA